MIAIFLNNLLIGFSATVIIVAGLYVFWALYGLFLHSRRHPRTPHRRSTTEEGGSHE